MNSPTPAQAAAEKQLRDLGATITFTPSAAVPHDHPKPIDGCIRCVMVASAGRVNAAEVTR